MSKITTLIIAVLVLMTLILGFEFVENRREIQAYKAQTELLASIRDTARYYRDQLGREVVEKRAIEANLSQLQALHTHLSNNQRHLLAEAHALPAIKKNRLVQATGIEQTVTVHIIDGKPLSVDTVLAPIDDSQQKRRLAWHHESDTLSYQIEVHDSTLVIEKLQLPNRLSVITYRDKDQRLHVQAVNTNPLYRTVDIDQIVPEKPRKKGIVGKVLLVVGGFLLGNLAHR